MELNKDKNTELIKKSFESKNSKAPEFVWENIDKKLYVERVWIKLKEKLDKIQRVKTAIRIFMYSTATLLLIVFAGTYYLSQKQDEPVVITGKKLVKPLQNTENNKLSGSRAGEEIADVQNTDNYASGMSGLPVEKSRSGTYATGNNVKVLSGANQASVIAEKTNAYSQENNSAINPAVLTNNKDSKQPGLLHRISPYKINAINYPVIDFPLLYNFRGNTILQKNNKFKRNELGLSYSINSTVVIDNNFLSSGREGSLISFNPTFASEFGFIYNYRISGQNAFSAEFFFISNHNQDIYLYSGGRYYKKITELDYSKLVVSYQQNVRFDFMIPDSWCFVKAGGYFSVLTKDNIYYVRNDERTELPNSMFSKNDYGINICLGTEFSFNNQIVTAAGLRSEYGLKNIFKGDANLPSDFNRTNNFSYGLFVTVKMRF